MHLRPDRWGGSPEIVDLWEMMEHAELLLTARPSEFPEGVSRQIPTERDPVGDPPNVWRVRAGDRVALIGERPDLGEGMIHCLLDFRECGLVSWRYGAGDLPSPMEAVSDTTPSGNQGKAEWARLAVAKVASMGVPNVFSEEWSL